MVSEIKRKYGCFSDSWISDIDVKRNHISIIITCANLINDCRYEVIELVFKNVTFYNNGTNENDVTISVKDALLEHKNGLIVFDLDPIDHFDYLAENENSDFKIISKEITCSFVKYFDK
ncbi:hypothetical protein [Maribacter sp. 2-571]|uniref:hypothetical protein n=1 Tax=Maribacter sp. 2-571 TaxID=3417569 RepID=UPI003D332282